MEKLVFTLSSLESFLLKAKGENIQQNLAERLSFLTKNTADERISLVKELKAVYGLRSDYLHHGMSTNDRDKLSSFFNLFVALLSNTDRFKFLMHFFTTSKRSSFSRCEIANIRLG